LDKLKQKADKRRQIERELKVDKARLEDEVRKLHRQREDDKEAAQRSS
jgi:hypothetical protein